MIAPKIDVLQAPTQTNRDCPWAVSVLNVTKTEAEMIAKYARGIRSVNSPRAQGMTATEMRERDSVPYEMRERENTEIKCSFAGHPLSAEGEPCLRCATMGQTGSYGIRVPNDWQLADRAEREATRKMQAMLGSQFWCVNGHTIPDEKSLCLICDRQRADQRVKDEAKKPLTEAPRPGNRFSGLDLD